MMIFFQDLKHNETCSATLHLCVANADSFMTYVLTADNEIGKNSHQVELIQSEIHLNNKP